jgi:hypothetical protein
LQGTVSPQPESWGTIETPALVELLELTTRRLQTTIESLAMDRGAYHRQYWTRWQRLTPEFSVAAKQRECELDCAPLNEQVILQEALVESLKAKRDGIVAALEARR